jgi:hypothetical protein
MVILKKEDKKMTAMKGNVSCLHGSRFCNLFTDKIYTVSTLNDVLDSEYPEEQ